MRRTFGLVVARIIIIIISWAESRIKQRDPVTCTQLAKTMIHDRHWCPTDDGDHPMRISATKIRKSKKISRVPAVQVWPCEKWHKRNTICSSEVKKVTHRSRTRLLQSNVRITHQHDWVIRQDEQLSPKPVWVLKTNLQLSGWSEVFRCDRAWLK